MKCPFCNCVETHVKDSRPIEEGVAVKRRRYCVECSSRFTTIERPQFFEILVVKKNGEKVAFDREKLAKSIYTALRKRPVDAARTEKMINSLARKLEMLGVSEISSRDIGEMVMDALASLDTVAFVRFASVYKEFNTPEDFRAFLDKVPTHDT